MEKWLCLTRSWSVSDLELWLIILCWDFEKHKLWLLWMLYTLWLQLLSWRVLQRRSTLKHNLISLIILQLWDFANTIIFSWKSNDCLYILISNVFTFFHFPFHLFLFCHHSQLELSKHFFKIFPNIRWFFNGTEMPCILE